MKTKLAKQPKRSRPAQLKDINPKKDAKAGARNGNLQITQFFSGAVQPNA